MEEFEYKGVWWVPGGNSPVQVTGTLTFSEDSGAYLDLLGTIEDVMHIIGRKAVGVFPVIQGMTTSGKKITLTDCFEAGSTIGSGGFPTARYRANIAFVGEHFNTPSDILLSDLTVEYQHLREWTCVQGLSYSETPGPPKGFQYAYAIPDSIIFNLPALEEMEFEISFSCNIGYKRDEVKLREQAWCEMTPKQPLSFKNYERAIFGMQDFLAFAVAHPVRPLSLYGTVANGTYFIEFDGEKIARNTTVSIYFSVRRVPGDTEILHPVIMMFPLDSVKERVGTLVDNWFVKRESLRPVFDLFFAVLKGTDLYSENRFLFTIQALETYHRRVNQLDDAAREKHNQRVQNIVDLVPDEDKEFVQGKLRYGYEPSLQTRLTKLIKKHKRAAALFISNPWTFAEKCVTTRNYLTHYEPSLKDKAVTNSSELYDLSQDLKLLLELCLLEEIGFSPEEIENLTRKRLNFGKHRLIPLVPIPAGEVQEPADGDQDMQSEGAGEAADD
jgi:hypothetical protein